MKKQILKQIRESERFTKIKRTVEEMSKKYGPITAAGGSLADCYFNLDFYDIDLFISVKDLKDEYKKDYKGKTHILDVLRDELDGEAIDIIVVDYSVKEHIRRFDQNFKKIWYDNNGVHIHRRAVKDIKENRISIGTVNGPVVYFRLLKSSKKYGMTLNETDMYLLRNYMSCLKRVHIPEKYSGMENLFVKINNPNYRLGYLVGDYTEYYWKKQLKKIPTWSMLKIVLSPALITMKLRNK